MRKIILFLGAFLLLCSQMPHDTILKGHINGFVSDDSLWVWGTTGKDTIAAPNGDFTYQYKEAKPGMVRIYKYPKQLPNGKMEALRMKPIQLFMFPGQSLKVNGDFDSYEISGNAFYEEYNKVNKTLAPDYAKVLNVSNEYMELMQAKAPREQILSKFEELKKVEASYHKRIEEYVVKHMDSEVSLYMLYLNRPRFGEKCLDKFPESIKNGNLKDLYIELSSYYEKMAARREAAAIIKEGKIAPDFLLKDINGKDFALSSLRGKYVVLDFWGSWCGWCVKGFPKMKEMYDKYSGKLEVVGIDCRDTEDKWKAAVVQNGLKWINVINGTDKNKDLTLKYNISGFPTKIILSPEGKIIKIIVGEKPEFYETIEKLMNK